MDFTQITLGELIQGGGVFSGAVLVVRYLISRDKKNYNQSIVREDKLVRRLEDVEDFQRGELAALSKATTKAVTENASALREFSETAKRMPCRMTDPIALRKVLNLGVEGD